MAGIFDGLDERQLARITEVVVPHLAFALALARAELARGDSIDRGTLKAGIARAHLFGAASALADAENAGALSIDDPAAIAMDAATLMIAAFGSMRGGR